MESVLMKEKKCWFCGTTYGLNDHHIFPSGADRPVSERLGLKVWLCYLHHDEVHRRPNKGLDKELKDVGRQYYLDNYGTLEQFMKDFRKSYM